MRKKESLDRELSKQPLSGIMSTPVGPSSDLNNYSLNDKGEIPLSSFKKEMDQLNQTNDLKTIDGCDQVILKLQGLLKELPHVDFSGKLHMERELGGRIKYALGVVQVMKDVLKDSSSDEHPQVLQDAHLGLDQLFDTLR